MVVVSITIGKPSRRCPDGAAIYCMVRNLAGYIAFCVSILGLFIFPGRFVIGRDLVSRELHEAGEMCLRWSLRTTGTASHGIVGK